LIVFQLEFSDFFGVFLVAHQGGGLLYKLRCSSVRAIFFACRVINVNSLPDVVSFTSLSAFKRSITMVDFHEFLMRNM